jgi:predicted nucleic acid-binding protein
MRRTGTERFLIDSSGWIEYFSGGKLAGKYARYIEKSKPGRNITPSVVLYEVYKKLMPLWSEEEALTAVAHIENCSTVIDVDARVAVTGAETSVEEKLPMADALIYGIAAMNGAKLVTSDSHFKGRRNVIFIK